MKKVTFKILLHLALGLVLINETFAQTLPGGDPPCGYPFDPCVPIDGGASILLGLGIIYGSKKVLDYNKKAKE